MIALSPSTLVARRASARSVHVNDGYWGPAPSVSKTLSRGSWHFADTKAQAETQSSARNAAERKFARLTAAISDTGRIFQKKATDSPQLLAM
eukprot:525818-Rhodomonas_salina.3